MKLEEGDLDVLKCWLSKAQKPKRSKHQSRQNWNDIGYDSTYVDAKESPRDARIQKPRPRAESYRISCVVFKDRVDPISVLIWL